MGKTSDQIYMNYQAMKQKAARLEELAKELRNATENQVAEHGHDQSSWKGDSGEAFRQKVTRLNYKIIKRADEIEKTAAALRKTAERQYKLEMKLIQLVSH